MVRRWCFGIALAALLAVATIAPVDAMAAQQGAREAASRPDFDPGAPPKTRLRLAPYLTFGAKIEIEYEFARNLDLNDAEDGDLSLLTPEVELAFSFDPSTRLQAFLNLDLSQEFALTGPRERERRLRIELKEAFLFFKDLAAGHLALQIGRQRFNDDREWLHDEELDAVRLFSRLADLELQLSVSRNGFYRKDFADKRARSWPTTIYSTAGTGSVRRRRSRPTSSSAIIARRSASARFSSDCIRAATSATTSSIGWSWPTSGVGKGRGRIRGWGLDVGLTYAFGFPYAPQSLLPTPSGAVMATPTIGGQALSADRPAGK